ncbi:DUF6182 family protein [Streptomyces tauricus]|uniref:DUF6182 family protein n=1 Tax=Streptomyces tauricus TaxID=68274 RepID=UPI00340799B2
MSGTLSGESPEKLSEELPEGLPGELSQELPEAALLTAAALVRRNAVRDGLGDAAAPWGLGVAVVVADLDVAAFLAGAADFALAIPADVRDGWYRSYTRTVFLAGTPASVAARHPHRHVTTDTRLSWHGPARRGALLPLSRLLRAFHGPAPIDVPPGPLTTAVSGTPSGRTVDAAIAIGGVSTHEYLIHAHHLIAEAALRGLIGPGDTIRVDHRQTLDVAEFREVLDPARADRVQTRVTHRGTDSGRLRLYGLLTSARPEGGH